MTEEYFHDGFLVFEFKESGLYGENGKNMHSDRIQDVCEIKSPLLIATACFDKQVRLISLQDKKLVGIFSGHLKGVN